MKTRHQKKPAMQKEIASERISILFEKAKESFEEDSALSDRYVHLAKKIAMKYKIKIPMQLKRSFCKHCISYLKPGANCRIRVQRGKAVYFCMKCRKFMRFPYLKERKK